MRRLMMWGNWRAPGLNTTTQIGEEDLAIRGRAVHQDVGGLEIGVHKALLVDACDPAAQGPHQLATTMEGQAAGLLAHVPFQGGLVLREHQEGLAAPLLQCGLEAVGPSVHASSKPMMDGWAHRSRAMASRRACMRPLAPRKILIATGCERIFAGTTAPKAPWPKTSPKHSVTSWRMCPASSAAWFKAGIAGNLSFPAWTLARFAGGPVAAVAAADLCEGILPMSVRWPSGGGPLLEGKAPKPEADARRARGLCAPGGRWRATVPVEFLPSKVPSRKRSFSL